MTKISLSCLLALGLAFFQSLVGQGIQKTWQINGFYSEGNTNQSLLTPSSLTGTLQITGTALNFNTNLGNWSDLDVSFVQNGDSYIHVVEFDRTDEDLEDGDDQRFVIRLIDEDTATLSYVLGQPVGQVDSFGGNSVEVIAAVLTTDPLPAPVPSDWAGEYSSRFTELMETNEGTYTHSTGSSSFTVIANSTETSFQLDQSGGSLISNLTLSGSSLAYTDVVADPYKIYDDSYFVDGEQFGPCYEYWENVYRDDWRVIQLGDGRLFALLIYFAQHEARFVGDEESCGEGAGVDDGNLFIGEFEVVTHLLSPPAIGEVTELSGTVWVERKGTIVSLSLGDPIYEGDVVETGASSFVRLALDDNSTMTISPQSKAEVTHFDTAVGEQPFSIITILKGFIRASHSTNCAPSEEPCALYQAGSTSIGVRGTEFTIDFSESGGIEEATVTVDSGIVETTNQVTGEVIMVEAGQSQTVEVQSSLTGSAPVPALGLAMMADNTINLNIKTDPLMNYQVEFSEDLASWDPFGPSFTGSGFIRILSESVGSNPQKFYRVVETPAVIGTNLTILEAEYGVNGTFNDVAAAVTSEIEGDTIEMKVNSFTLGGDPVPGSVKTFYIRYQNSLGQFEVLLNEGETLRIPDLGHTAL
ncbi:MAG: FecR domain-containing protein [Opitutales bacterium]